MNGNIIVDRRKGDKAVVESINAAILSGKKLMYVFDAEVFWPEGRFKGYPQEVVRGGLGRVQQAPTNLKERKVSAVKYVFRIG